MCPSCRQQANIRFWRAVTAEDLPPLLAVNACAYDASDAWTDARGSAPLLASRFGLQLEDGGEEVEYQIRALVVQVVNKEEHLRPHLVALVKVPEAEGRDDLASPWHLFNDFVVKNISEQEALSFPGRWKVRSAAAVQMDASHTVQIPTVIYLERVDVRDKLDFSQMPTTIDPAILCQDMSMSLCVTPRIVRPWRSDASSGNGTVH